MYFSGHLAMFCPRFLPTQSQPTSIIHTIALLVPLLLLNSLERILNKEFSFYLIHLNQLESALQIQINNNLSSNLSNQQRPQWNQVKNQGEIVSFSNSTYLGSIKPG